MKKLTKREQLLQQLRKKYHKKWAKGLDNLYKGEDEMLKAAEMGEIFALKEKR